MQVKLQTINYLQVLFYICKNQTAGIQANKNIQNSNIEQYLQKYS